MSVLGGLFSGVAGVLYAFVGELATYTGADGVVVSGLILQMDRAETTQLDTDTKTRSQRQTCAAAIAQSALPKPSTGGRFQVGNEVWTIETTPVLRNGQHYFAMSRTGDQRIGAMSGSK